MGRIFAGGAPDIQSREPDFQSRDPEFESRDPELQTFKLGLPTLKVGSPSPKLLAQVYCGQTAGWIKMALGMEVGLSPGDFVLDDDPAPPQKRGGAPSPIFGPFLLWPNG